MKWKKENSNRYTSRKKEETGTGRNEWREGIYHGLLSGIISLLSCSNSETQLNILQVYKLSSAGVQAGSSQYTRRMFYCCMHQAVILGSVGIAVGYIIHSNRFDMKQSVHSHYTAVGSRQENRTRVKVMRLSTPVTDGGKQLIHNRKCLELIPSMVSSQRADSCVRKASDTHWHRPKYCWLIPHLWQHTTCALRLQQVVAPCPRKVDALIVPCSTQTHLQLAHIWPTRSLLVIAVITSGAKNSR